MIINFSLIEVIIIGVLILLGIVKTFLFFKIADHKNFSSWFRFSIYEIYNSPGRRIEKAKKYQNNFSLAIFCLILFALIIYLLLHR